MNSLSSTTKVQPLVERLDRAVEESSCEAICHAVKTALEELIASGQCVLESRFQTPVPDKYARRLVHKHPDGKYVLMAMVWGPGQGTMIHDHSGMWCVECVYRGRIEVVSYDLVGTDTDVPCSFTREKLIHAGPGEAGALIPPFDYHTITNVDDDLAVTLHVYGGEMNWCHVFVPMDGGYRRERRDLCYTD
ncbi:MAG: cysteine dioxygenase [Fimbriimonadaceae bacterium]